MNDMRPIVTGLGTPGTNSTNAVAPSSPTLQQEVGYLNGLNPDGTINNNSYWGASDTTAHKWGAPTAGTGATISYSFDAASNFSATEKATFLKAFALWQSVANVKFVESTDQSSANVLLQRGNDGSAYTSLDSSEGAGSKLGSVIGQALISIDTSVPGFDLSGSLNTLGGYGQSTVTHEVGHLLGLGHGGDYNGNVNEATDQFSAYDDRMYTTMSYIFWAETDAKYASQNPVQGTNWGITQDGYYRQAPHTVMELDILAVQQLYGKSTPTQLDGGTTYGFHTNIKGPLHDFFDFNVNTDPVVTLYNVGTGNTLDLSGYAANQRIDLHPGSFSDVGGHFNNVAIAFSTQIEKAIGGSGNDTITASDVTSTLLGGGGSDTLIGGAGNDSLNGQGGTDSMSGGAGNDSYYVDNNQDRVTELANAGIDRVVSTIDYQLTDNVENLFLQGTATYGRGNALDNVISGNNVFNILYGYDGKDSLSGMGGDDVLRGGAGADKLNGGDGNDTLIGGPDKDSMAGGAGGDAFVFANGDFSGATATTADLITDFNSSQGDYIDLLGVDANTAVAGAQAFTFLGTSAFDGTAGELRYQVYGSSYTMVYGDTNGDKVADFAIRLTGVHALTSNDFNL